MRHRIMSVTLLSLLLMIPISARAETDIPQISITMDGAERSYMLEILPDTLRHWIDLGWRSASNDVAIPVSLFYEWQAGGVKTAAFHLPWLRATLQPDALTVPEGNELLHLHAQGVEPMDQMRAAWRLIRPASLVDPFALSIRAEYTPQELAPGIVGTLPPDPEDISGRALGFEAAIRYRYGKERIRVLRWDGFRFVDIPGANWEVFEEEGQTYVRAYGLEDGIYAIIDGKSG